MHHGTRCGSEAASTAAQALTDSLTSYAPASVQYPANYSRVDIRDITFQYPGTHHHGNTRNADVVFDGDCLSMEFTAWSACDVTPPVPYMTKEKHLITCDQAG